MITYTVTPKLAATLTAGTRFLHDGHVHTITRVNSPGDWEVKCGCIDDGQHSMDLFYVPDPGALVDVIIEEAEPTDAEIEAAAVEFEQHEQFWYGDDDQPRCECGFRLEESLNGTPIPSLQMHQARAALVAARTAANHE